MQVSIDTVFWTAMAVSVVVAFWCLRKDYGAAAVVEISLLFAVGIALGFASALS